MKYNWIKQIDKRYNGRIVYRKNNDLMLIYNNCIKIFRNCKPENDNIIFPYSSDFCLYRKL